MLPENGAFERLDSLIESATVQNLFSRDVLRVDLRLPDRITVALSDEVLERHRAFVAEEQRVLKARKAGKL